MVMLGGKSLKSSSGIGDFKIVDWGISFVFIEEKTICLSNDLV